VLALSDVSATLGIVAVFGVIFPALVQGILMFIAAAVAGERRQNAAYRPGGKSAQ